MSFSVGPPLIRAMNCMSVLPQLSYKIDQMEALFNIPPLKEGKTDFNGNDLQIRFENVRFSYEKDEVLHGISFSVPQGSLTALVGESGSGKSTLAKLLVHFYDVTDGHITLGGQDLREMSLASLNEQISFVAQEQFLFNTSPVSYTHLDVYKRQMVDRRWAMTMTVLPSTSFATARWTTASFSGSM